MRNSKILLESISKLTNLDRKKSEKVAKAITQNHTIRAICEDPIFIKKSYETRKN